MKLTVQKKIRGMGLTCVVNFIILTSTMRHLLRPVKYGGITSYDITLCVDFFKNDHNQVNIEDPIEDIMRI